MDIKKYCVVVYKDELPTNTYYAIGIIQGLLSGICSVQCNTTLYDTEIFNESCMMFTDCTSECIMKFKSIMDKLYPGSYIVEEALITKKDNKHSGRYPFD